MSVGVGADASVAARYKGAISPTDAIDVVIITVCLLNDDLSVIGTKWALKPMQLLHATQGP